MPKKNDQDLRTMLESIASSIKKGERLSTTDWILKHKIKTEDGRPFEFKNRRFMVDVLNDLTPEQSIMACAQVGKTTGMYIKCAKLGIEDNMNIIMSEPTESLRNDLVKSKLNKLIANNQILRDNMQGGLDFKNMGKANMFLTYTNGIGGIGISADIIVADEVSRSNIEMIETYKSRLLNSQYKWFWKISNPYMPEDLLHREFLDSDQKHWAFKPSCGCKRQILNWDGMYGYKGNVDKDKKIFVCQYCGKEVNRQDIIDGEWVARYQSRRKSGFWIHQLLRWDVDLEEMCDVESKNQSLFHNFYMGIPYSGSDVTVDAKLFKDHITSPIHPSTGVVCGADIGSATGHHMVFMKNDTVYRLARAQDFEEIEALLIEENVEYLTVDYMPEYEGAKKLQSHFPNIVRRCRYLNNRTTKDDVVNFEDDKGMVHVVRNIMFDNIINDIASGKYKFAFREGDYMFEQYIKHFSTLSKIFEVDANGSVDFKWLCPDGAHDHFAHAMLYACVSSHTQDKYTPIWGTYSPDTAFQRTRSDGQEYDSGPKLESDNEWYNL